MTARLSLETLSRAHSSVARPAVDPSAMTRGIAHLGVGAFHRAHQALLTEDAMSVSGDTSWAITGATQRSAAVAQQMRPQDCLYTVLEKSPGVRRARIVGAIRDVIPARHERDAVFACLADPMTRVISLTITEKGYLLGGGGGLDLDHPEVVADVAAVRRGGVALTAPGILLQGLLRRAAAPVTVMPCDNMVANGATLARVVREFAEAAGCDATLPGVRFVSTVVDRIVPAPSESARAEVESLVGLRDEAAVSGEPFWQWVIEDDFGAGRPAWDRVGVTLTADVEPYELLKLRLLNSSHSLLAYLGALAGYPTIAGAMGVPAYEAAARRLICEAISALELPDGVDPHAYGESVLERYRNHDLGHQTTQVAMDGSKKLPLRIPPTALALLRRGEDPVAAALTVAAWIAYVARGRDAAGRALPLEDPRADELRAAARGSAAGVVDRVLDLPVLLPADLADDERWRVLVREAFARFASKDPSSWAAF